MHLNSFKFSNCLSYATYHYYRYRYFWNNWALLIHRMSMTQSSSPPEKEEKLMYECRWENLSGRGAYISWGGDLLSFDTSTPAQRTEARPVLYKVYCIAYDRLCVEKAAC